MPLVISACSNRKRASPAARAAELTPGPVASVGQKWLFALVDSPRIEAGALYCGRNVADAQKAAAALNAALLFASAGLGWVPADRRVPSYGMTIVAGDDDVRGRLADDASANAWWAWLTAHSPFSTTLTEAMSTSVGIALVALPRAYLAMVADDILALSDAQRERLRIVQRATGAVESLLPWTIAYDDRLDGGAGHAGTRSDFAGRAARHFAESVFPGRERENVLGHARAVDLALTDWQATPQRRGERRTDDELRAIITDHWAATKGRTTLLLRVLRDELGIACEQGRFARLVSAMRKELI